MSSPSFVHLHVHSEFSLLDGLSRIDELVARAVELEQPAIALTDHGAMYGTMPFYRACKKAGIKPIIGIETYVAARTMQDRDAQLDKNRFHMLLLAQNQTGYLNLLQVASSAQLEGYYYKPRIDRPFMANHSDGVIATTGCMAAEIPQAIHQHNPKLAKQLMGEYLDIFGKERFFIELQEHSIPDLSEINKQLIEMAPHFGLQNNFLATNDVHYTRAEDADPHQMLLCIQTSSTIDQPKMTFSDNHYYLKSGQEMQHLLRGYADDVVLNSLQNSLLIAEMCDVNLDSEGYHLPDFEVPAGFDARSYLRHLCEQGLVWRYGENRAKTNDMLKARLEHELGIIGRMGFETYFLIVWDLCEWAVRSDTWWEKYQDPFPYSDYGEWKKNDVWFNVRGSGAGSVVAYTLGITSIDPLVNGLIFERFLNPGRVSMPDIDLDYPDDVRHEMVQYAMRRYGQEKVAQIITFGTMGARAAIRDVGRAMGLELDHVDGVARLIPAIPGKPAKIKDVLNSEHEFYSTELEERYKREGDVKSLLDMAQSMEGLARHASSHAAGVIISDKPLHEYVPLNRPTSGDEGLGGIDRVTQWPMEIVESIGLLKVDFLGLSTLTIMRRAARLIEERYGVSYTMDNIPYDEGHVGPDPTKDPKKAFEMLSRGEVAGVFQVEGAGMRRLMIDMKPSRFDHIIAAISLYRPGPMENIPEYIRRMHAAIYEGQTIFEYHTPDLEPILKDTYGILVYQEQIIRIASDLAGYAPGDADMIRKAVAKKKKKLMEEHRVKFTDGAMARGYSREVCEAIWGDIEFFARYGFNKAHAADYAKVTCQTAFLKAHYPVEYLAAMLSVERDNTDKVRRYFAEAKNLGIDVGPPAINSSMLDFAIEDEGERPLIRFGLGAIKNAGASALSLIIEERETNGRFKDLQDLCDRVDLRRVGKRALEFMIKAQVFKAWGTVPQFLDALDRLVSESGRSHDAAAAGQMSLFGGFGGGQAAASFKANLLRNPKKLKEIEHKKILEMEKEALGVHVSEHPLERPLAMLQQQTSTTIGDIDANSSGKTVRVAGMISSLRTLTTKKGDPMAFGTLEDLDDKIDVVFFPRTWKAVREMVAVDQVMLVTGKVQAKESDQLSLLADRVQTKLEQGRAADEEWGYEMPSPPPTPVVRKNGNGNGRSAHSNSQNSAPPVAEPSPALAGSPPPPPNFADDFGGVPVVPAVPEEAPPLPAAKKREPKANGRSTKPIMSSQEANGMGNENGRYDTLTIEINNVSNWKEVARQAVNLTAGFQGQDRFQLRLAGQSFSIDFPDHSIEASDELIDKLERLAGIRRVFRG